MIRVVKPHPFPGLGLKIREARGAKGMSQPQLAKHLGTRKGLVSLWEREKNCPSDKYLLKLETTLGVAMPKRVYDAKGRRATSSANCPTCGKTFHVYYGQKFCSTACANVSKSINGKGRNWRGGRFVHASGYAHVRQPDHPGADRNGYVLEHRLVMERHLGRRLSTLESVHHRNGDRSDNRLENLELWACSKRKQSPGQRIVDLIEHLLSKRLSNLPKEVRMTIMSAAKEEFSP